ncbi:MAG: polymerase sigma factor [Flaviaesturariibacter sp.]|nr:polymerase sigma factor [Flaviaesturariibacter sp.]
MIEGCQRGDRKSQEILYRNYYRAMITLCLRYTKNEADAVEVLNNGFLKVFKYIQRYDPGQASLYTWIRTIVVRSCLDFIRAKQRIEPHTELTDAGDSHIPAEAVSKMKAAELLQLVRRLPAATQAVFNLYVIEGYNHREIGELLDIQEGTSKWHLSMARKALRKMIETQEISE